jgi:hypothetical protein
MVEIYLVNSSKKEYVFLNEGYNVGISWVFRYCWDTKDNVYILNMNECGLMLPDEDEEEYISIELKNGYITKYDIDYNIIETIQI